MSSPLTDAQRRVVDADTAPGTRTFPALAAWLHGKRPALEARLAARIGRALDPGAVEFEALRRFRSFAVSALRGVPAEPALDGLRVVPRRAETWIDAWIDSAVLEAGSGGATVGQHLRPLGARFKEALQGTSRGRAAAGRPRSSRRFVTAAIDRIALPFLAIDPDDGAILDANPAAAAFFEISRDVLVGSPVTRWLAIGQRTSVEAELDAIAEGGEQRRFGCVAVTERGREAALDVHLTRYVRRGRVTALALVYASRPANRG